ncbi:Muramoyltetrapeptide carboxypeptidase LdcA (peptidoglycan recycling) [Halobacillus karajensis]|uniref:S66 family peptidase n=1 Tax=Halobacillus karajensis TaxID=195088 RepID=UPI0008A730F9|nr:S66 peptidase family protein [Halobacillus karajensis]SEH67506.1 Muramoyltetrapeptide carboxypeptidase LdcA (peptidoglycan recycling) [Halobacillus karajensis]
MVKYPSALEKGDKLAVTAPSSGVEEHLHMLVHKAKEKVEHKGFIVQTGNTIWTETKSSSANAHIRAKELTQFLEDENIKAIIPPWGGQFAMEILPMIDWNYIKTLPPKWILGYSDISTILLVYTTITGNASAHGTNFNELSAPEWDELTAKWTEVLGCSIGQDVIQYSSNKYQSSWKKTFENPATGFYFDAETEWKSHTGEKSHEFSGRLLGGVMNTLQTLIGTPYDKVNEFTYNHAQEGVIWYLESVDWSAAEIYRCLWQMKYNGWFKNANGVLIGRASGYSPTKDFEVEDALINVFGEEVPVVYDADIGHMPPQNILVNGAYSTVTYQDGKGTIRMQYI